MNNNAVALQVAQRSEAGLSSRWGIGPASVYLRQPGVEQFARAAGVGDWEDVLKQADARLAYCDQGMGVLSSCMAGSEWSVSDLAKSIDDEAFDIELLKKQAEPTPGSIMDFECIVTTSQEDRDGDVLDPKGAELDPNAPLLMYHLATLPIGKVLAETRRNAKRLCARCAIADTELGRDAATLVEFGALRISHGFLPREYEERRNKEGEQTGWLIKSYEILEVSLVPIPSNTGAVILAQSRGKLFHPATKAWAKSLDEERTDKVLPVAVAPEPEVAKEPEVVKETVSDEVSDLDVIQKAEEPCGQVEAQAEVEPEVKNPETTEAIEVKDSTIVLGVDETVADIAVKSGRSMSRKNESAVRDAIADLEAAVAIEGTPRAAIALVNQALTSLRPLVEMDDEDDDDMKRFEVVAEKLSTGDHPDWEKRLYDVLRVNQQHRTRARVARWWANFLGNPQ